MLASEALQMWAQDFSASSDCPRARGTSVLGGSETLDDPEDDSPCHITVMPSGNQALGSSICMPLLSDVTDTPTKGLEVKRARTFQEHEGKLRTILWTISSPNTRSSGHLPSVWVALTSLQLILHSPKRTKGFHCLTLILEPQFFFFFFEESWGKYFN